MTIDKLQVLIALKPYSDMDQAEPVSFSVANKLEVANVHFCHETGLDMFASAAHELVKKKIMANVKKEHRIIKGIWHATLNDGSERDLWVDYGTDGREHILVEISHKWIDANFLSFWLWQQSRPSEYPIDYLFVNDTIAESFEGRSRIGEIFVALCRIKIHTVISEPENFLPSKEDISEYIKESKVIPQMEFWNAFKEKKYDIAALHMKRVSRLHSTVDSQHFFLRAVEALCYLKGGENVSAANEFLEIGTGFEELGLERYCDVCLFFSIEAAKGADDISQSMVLVQKIADGIPNLLIDQRRELSNILISYITSVYIGVVVLCRRIIELAIKDILTAKYRISIDTLVNECMEAGELRRGVRHGLYALLVVAKWKGVLSPHEYEIASNIKDFGDRIHDKGGVENADDAKYAIQSCIHILRRLRSR